MLTFDQAAQAFAAIGFGARLEILRLLARARRRDGLSINDIQSRLGIPRSTLNHHLKSLVAAGLIKQHRKGRTIRSQAYFTRIKALATFLIAEYCANTRRTDANSSSDRSFEHV